VDGRRAPLAVIEDDDPPSVAREIGRRHAVSPRNAARSARHRLYSGPV